MDEEFETKISGLTGMMVNVVANLVAFLSQTLVLFGKLVETLLIVAAPAMAPAAPAIMLGDLLVRQER